MLDNWIKTTTLMVLIIILFVSIGALIAGPFGAVIALLMGSMVNIFAYWNSDQLVLSYYDAKEVTPQSQNYLYFLVHELAQNAGLPMPKVYIVNESQPNAFATGRNPENAAVAVTAGLLSLLTTQQLKGVIAHELSHILHRDTLIATIIATIAGAISSMAQWMLFFGMSSPQKSSENDNIHPAALLILAILAPIAALIIQMTISRVREFEADRQGAIICQDPEALAQALEQLELYSKNNKLYAAERHPETAQMMIINPFAGNTQFLTDLFKTHPSTAERVKRLRELPLPPIN